MNGALHKLGLKSNSVCACGFHHFQLIRTKLFYMLLFLARGKLTAEL
jgi:hypothetical protein